MKGRYGLVVFDWDGTLFDSVDWIVECIQRAADACNCQVPDSQSARSVIGLGLSEAMATLFPGAEGLRAKALIQEYRRVYHSRAFSEQDLFPSVRDVLGALRGRGYRLAVATGKTREGLRSALQLTGTATLFDASRSADETASKPNPLMLKELMDELGVDSGRTLMVGDSVHDLRMAQNAGVDAVAVTTGAHAEGQLRALQPVLCLESVAALLPYLDSDNSRLADNKLSLGADDE